MGATMTNSYSLKGMSWAIARSDGKAIKFSLLTHSGQMLQFECPPEAIPEIVARLTGALEQATMNSQPKGRKFVSQPIVADEAEVSANRSQETVIATFFPTPHCGVPFAMTPELANKVSSGLAAAIAILRPASNLGSLS